MQCHASLLTRRSSRSTAQVHGLACAGVGAEWLRCVDGSLRLVAVHSVTWADDQTAPHDLARVASSLSLALPPGTRGLERAQAGGLEPGNGVKPGWNTNTSKMTTFQAGSPFRPDRVEPPPPTVHPPSEVRLALAFAYGHRPSK